MSVHGLIRWLVGPSVMHWYKLQNHHFQMRKVKSFGIDVLVVVSTEAGEVVEEWPRVLMAAEAFSYDGLSDRGRQFGTHC